ncbi:hypothetical protein GQ53DRAFT_809795 [Thozetella sp. PMI_491]|nr:hypothetical protein GQ53DRAFT_809795 [Thozetella sp. PMI_491]
MVYRSRGLPSPGCNICRSRKIRCDETKPICNRCTKAGYTECKYRDEFERTWRFQSVMVMDKTQEESAAKGSQSIEVNSDIASGSSRSPSAQGSSPTNGTVPHADERPDRPGAGGLEPRILDRFFYDWTLTGETVPGQSLSWFKVLPRIYAEADPNGLLAKAVHTVAYARAAHTFRKPALLTEAATSCGEVLHLIKNKMMSTIDTCPTDEMMISVILLGIYEAMVDPTTSPNSSWLAHTGGAATLLRLRIQKQTKGPQGDLDISVMIFRQMLHGCLISGRAPTLPLKLLAGFFPPGLEHVYAHADLMTQSAFLFSEWKEALEDSNIFSMLEKLPPIVSAATTLDRSFDDWSRDLPETCAYGVQPLTRGSYPEWMLPLLVGEWAPQSSHAYHSPLTKMLWTFYWQTRLILNQALLHTVTILDEHGLSSSLACASRQEIEFRLVSFADRLCESCLTPLIASTKANPQTQSINDIRGLQAYLLLHIVPTVALCLNQAAITGIDLAGRQEWAAKMKRFLSVDLGFAKGGAEASQYQSARVPIQIWGS